ncbi:MAG: uncharacterized protein conserved in bacteria (DUF2309) [Halonotius sp. J07HN6]|nr:MAG: uncharacterized protein conserved in bacteria (DUF2309) [Halonotius sp. J07HN6]
MSTESTIHDSIDSAATTVGSVWPIHSFVTANPLSGFEDQPFADAVEEATDLLGGRGYPCADTFRTALERGQIDQDILVSELNERGYEADPETLLDRIAEADPTDGDTVDSDEESDADRVDAVLTKWLAAFLDEGRAHWPMPNREEGFYGAFRTLVDHDGEIPSRGVVADLPESPTVTIEAVVDDYPDDQWDAIFEEQLAALPGWTGFIKQRAEANGEWQSECPITVEGYLAVRLALLDALASISPRRRTPTAESRSRQTNSPRRS